MKKLLLLILLLPVMASGAVDKVKVYGYFKDPSATSDCGIVMEAYLSGGAVVVDTTSETEARIITKTPVSSTNSDSLGYWYMYLLPSGDYSDTSVTTYDFIGGGIELRDMWLPDVDSLNLADSLAGR